MAFFYHQANSLDALFPELYRLIKAERKTLRPQTPQTIIVGNLDVEAWIEEQFISEDGVLMGVQFPFLETALDTFADRQTAGLFPAAHESWFNPVTGTQPAHKKAGMLELELIILNLLSAYHNGSAAEALNFDVGALGPLQRLTLAQKIAREIREYLLHAPDAMQLSLSGKASHPIARFWKIAHEAIDNAGFTSEMFLTGNGFKAAKSEPSLFGPGSQSALYLFGMPVLSAYHIGKLCKVARAVDVHLMGIHPPVLRDAPEYFAAVAKKYERYLSFISDTAAKTGTPFSAERVPEKLSAWLQTEQTSNQQSPVEFLGLPGAWRGAEILADIWHEALRTDEELRQDDFSLALTDAASLYPAFDKACGARRLSVFMRNRLFERAESWVELVAIFAAAAADGIHRELIVRYLANAVVRERFRLDTEKTELFVRALTEANGFRNDYPASLAVFNLTAALGRLDLGLMVDPATAETPGLPGAAYLRSFDTAELLGELNECIGILLTAGETLKPQRGAELIRLLTALLSRLQGEPSGGFTSVIKICTEIAEIIPKNDVTLQQIARILKQHVQGKSLAQSAQRQGICASPLSASAFVRRRITLMDMNEELDGNDEAEEGLLPEYLKSPTRLSKAELTAIQLVQAALSDPDVLQICYSNTDPKTGAEKYRSTEIERFKASLSAANIAFNERHDFPVTIFDTAAGTAANAADGEVRLVRLCTSPPRQDARLSQVLLPPVTTRVAETLEVKDLVAYISKPLEYILRREAQQSEDPVDFSYAEPKLAESKGAQFRFAENYLRRAVLSPTAAPLPSAIDALEAQRRRGLLEPEGFDFMRRLLLEGNNAQIISEFAAAQRSEFQVVEYIFDNRVASAFRVKEDERFSRVYLPAPRIGDTLLTGIVGKFLETPGNNYLYLLESSLAAKRTESWINAYVRLAAFLGAGAVLPGKMPAGIRSLQYDIQLENDDTKNKLTIAAKVRFAAEAAKLRDADQYLARAVEAIQNLPPVYFNAELLGKNNLSHHAASSDEKILALLQKGQADKETRDEVAGFYAAEVNQESVAFFNVFIRPIAELDAEKPAGKTSKKKA